MQKGISAFTFDQVLETVAEWPFERQEMLFDVLHRRQVAIRRQEMAQNVRDAVTAFHRGELQSENAPDAIARLRTLLAEEV